MKGGKHTDRSELEHAEEHLWNITRVWVTMPISLCLSSRRSALGTGAMVFMLPATKNQPNRLGKAEKEGQGASAGGGVETHRS